VKPASVNGSRQLLTQLLVNLLENAIEHAGRGCTVSVSVESTDRGARMVVADDGPGMAPAESERALRPFAKRAAGSSTGTHLGLSLVASIARLHKGRLRLEDNAPGLRVVVEFE
jgi:signal transduction histidine kinase